MGLFDVIRYPVLDIYDDEEMSKIPYEIIEDWALFVIEFSGYSTVPDSLHPTTKWGTIAAYSIIYYCNVRGLDRNTNDTEILANMLKAYFTNNLRQRIKAYEKE